MVTIILKVSLWALVFFGISLLLLKLLGEYSLFCCLSEGPSSTKMKWREVKELYKINPERWNYDSDAPILWYNKTVCVRLSLLGYTALIWHNYIYTKRRNRDEERCYSVASMKYILETVQRDIDQLRQEAAQEISAAIKSQEEILERTRKDA